MPSASSLNASAASSTRSASMAPLLAGAFAVGAAQNLMAPNLSAVAASFRLTPANRDLVLGGWMSAAFFLVGAPASVFIGARADDAPRIPLFSWVVGLAGLVAALTGAAWSVHQLLVLRILHGALHGAMQPILFSVVGDLFTPAARPTQSSYVGLAIGGGTAVGQLTAGLLASAVPWHEGWRLSYAIVAVACGLASLGVRLRGVEPRRGGAGGHAKTNGGGGGDGREESSNAAALDDASTLSGAADGGGSSSGGVEDIIPTTGAASSPRSASTALSPVQLQQQSHPFSSTSPASASPSEHAHSLLQHSSSTSPSLTTPSNRGAAAAAATHAGFVRAAAAEAIAHPRLTFRKFRRELRRFWVDSLTRARAAVLRWAAAAGGAALNPLSLAILLLMMPLLLLRLVLHVCSRALSLLARTAHGVVMAIPLILDTGRMAEIATHMRSSLSSLRIVLSVRTNALILGQGLFGTIPWSVVTVFLTDYLMVEGRLGAGTATSLVAVFGVGAVVGAIMGGRAGSALYARWGPRAVPLAAGLAQMASAAPMAWLIAHYADGPSGGMAGDRDAKSGLGPVYAVAASAGLIASCAGPNLKAMLLNANPPATHASVFGWAYVIDSVAKGAAPALIGSAIAAAAAPGGSGGSGRSGLFLLAMLGWVASGAVIISVSACVEADERRARAAAASNSSSFSASGGTSAVHEKRARAASATSSTTTGSAVSGSGSKTSDISGGSEQQ